MRSKLVYLPNWVGDFLMAWASLRWCLGRDVLLFGKPRFRELVEGDLSEARWIPKSGSFTRDWLRLFKSEAVEAVLLPNSFSSALITTLAGMRTVGIPSDGRGFLLNKRVLPRCFHQADVYREILDAAGLKVPERPLPSLSLAPEHLEWAEDRLRRAGFGNTPVFCVHPGASKSQRCWMVEGFAQVCRRLLREGFGIVIVGGGADSREAEAVEEMVSGSGVLNLAREDVSLGRLAAVISLACGFLGNDSGPLHIAAAAGVPSVGIYGTSVPEKTGPVTVPGVPFVPVCSRFPCSPCRERFFKECEPQNGKPPCIAAISVEDVWGAVEEVLGL